MTTKLGIMLKEPVFHAVVVARAAAILSLVNTVTKAQIWDHHETVISAAPGLTPSAV